MLLLFVDVVIIILFRFLWFSYIYFFYRKRSQSYAIEFLRIVSYIIMYWNAHSAVMLCYVVASEHGERQRDDRTACELTTFPSLYHSGMINSAIEFSVDKIALTVSLNGNRNKKISRKKEITTHRNTTQSLKECKKILLFFQ